MTRLEESNSESADLERKQKALAQENLSDHEKLAKFVFKERSSDNKRLASLFRAADEYSRRADGPSSELATSQERLARGFNTAENLRQIQLILSRQANKGLFHQGYYSDSKKLEKLEREYRQENVVPAAQESSESTSQALPSASQDVSDTRPDKRAHPELGQELSESSSRRMRFNSEQPTQELITETESTNLTSTRRSPSEDSDMYGSPRDIPARRSPSEDSDMYGSPRDLPAKSRDKEDDNNGKGGPGTSGFPPSGSGGPSGSNDNGSSSGPGTHNRVQENQSIAQLFTDID